MDHEGFEVLMLGQFLKLTDVCNEVAMKIEGSKLGIVLKVVVDSLEVVMREVEPLQIGMIGHHINHDFRESGEFPDFVVAEDHGAAHQLNLNRLPFLLLQFLFGLGGDVPHS